MAEKKTIREKRAPSTSTSRIPQRDSVNGSRKTRKREAICRLRQSALEIKTKKGNLATISSWLTQVKPNSSQTDFIRI